MSYVNQNFISSKSRFCTYPKIFQCNFDISKGLLKFSWRSKGSRRIISVDQDLCQRLTWSLIPSSNRFFLGRKASRVAPLSVPGRTLASIGLLKSMERLFLVDPTRPPSSSATSTRARSRRRCLRRGLFQPEGWEPFRSSEKRQGFVEAGPGRLGRTGVALLSRPRWVARLSPRRFRGLPLRLFSRAPASLARTEDGPRASVVLSSPALRGARTPSDQEGVGRGPATRGASRPWQSGCLLGSRRRRGGPRRLRLDTGLRKARAVGTVGRDGVLIGWGARQAPRWGGLSAGRWGRRRAEERRGGWAGRTRGPVGAEVALRTAGWAPRLAPRVDRAGGGGHVARRARGRAEVVEALGSPPAGGAASIPGREPDLGRRLSTTAGLRRTSRDRYWKGVGRRLGRSQKGQRQKPIKYKPKKWKSGENILDLLDFLGLRPS